MFSDWYTYFWPQLLDPWHVQRGVFNLPWLFVILQPLRILGPQGALFVVEVASLFVILKLGLSLQLTRWQMLMVIFSPPVLWNAFMGQIDGLLMSAFLMPPLAASTVVLFKPQTNVGAGWLAVRKQPWVLIWIVILLVSSVLIWNWPFSTQAPETGGPTSAGLWNWSPWPWGLLLLPVLLLTNNRRVAMFVSPFLFPYSGLQSLIGPMLVAAGWRFWAFGLVWFATWLRWAYMIRLL